MHAEPRLKEAGRKRWLGAIPLLISIGSIVCVAWLFLVHAPDLPDNALRGMTLRIPAAAVAYAALASLLGIAWWWLVGAYDRRPALATAYALWARTQIAKYLPGNVFHVAGRHAGGRAVGLSHQGLAASLVFETGSTIIAALLVAVLAAVPNVARLPPRWTIALAAAGAVVLWPLVDRGLRRLPLTADGMTRLPPLPLARALRLLAPALLLHLAFLGGTGMILWFLARAGGTGPEVGVLAVVPAYALAWLAGTLVLGAPGGLGVREAVLVVQLAPSFGSATATAAALALRAVTLAGDAATALLGLWIGRDRGTR